MCFKKSRETTNPLFASKNILPFHKNLQLQAGKFLWRAANDCLCPTLNPLFNMRDVAFHVPHRHLDVSQNSVTYSGVKFWNATPSEIRSSSSLNIFKDKYKKHLIDNTTNINNLNNNNDHSNITNNNNNNNNNNNRNPRINNNQRWRLNDQPFTSRWDQVTP